MPYRFVYSLGDGHRFSCLLKKRRCRGKTLSGRRCNRRMYLSLPYCWFHLRREKRVAVMPSAVHGTGLFAYEPDLERRDLPVFTDGSGIIPYTAEYVTPGVLADRYRSGTGPYAVMPDGEDYFADAACKRGAAANANTVAFKAGTRLRYRRVHGLNVPVNTLRMRSADGTFRNARINAIIMNSELDGPYLMAIRDIMHLDEILVYYGKQYLLEDNHRTTYASRRIA